MPELRKDPLMGRWVIISTERSKRPDEFLPQTAVSLEEQPDCPFCEGHEGQTPPEIMAVRPGGSPANQPSWSVRVIPSISPVLRIEGKLTQRAQGVYDLVSGIGAHEVVVETPQHLAGLVQLGEEQVGRVIQVYVQRIKDLERDPRFKYVLIFKNVGERAGGGRFRHCRSQIIALPVNPIRLKDELQGARHYYERKERCIFCDILHQELEAKVRVACETAHFVALAPFASRFPFEQWILPKAHSADFTHLSPEGQGDLARILQQVLAKLGRILNNPPYHTILHTAPFRRPRPGYWKTIEQDFHWHLEMIPRLTRVAGFEWGSGFYINPTPPEEAARFFQETEVTAAPHG